MFELAGYHWEVAEVSPSERLTVNVEIEDFADKLKASGKLPTELGEAPIASWVLARLFHVAGELSIPSKQTNDGGGWVLEVVLRDEPQADAPAMGRVQLQGTTERVCLFGSCGGDEQQLAKALLEALVAEPNAVRECRIAVFNPEWPEDPGEYSPRPKSTTRNKYGWDGTKYLGSKNVREKSAVPEKGRVEQITDLVAEAGELKISNQFGVPMVVIRSGDGSARFEKVSAEEIAAIAKSTGLEVQNE